MHGSLSLSHYDVFALTETWLNDTFFDSELFNSHSYDVFRTDRNYSLSNNMKGGGCLLAIRKNLLATLNATHNTFQHVPSIDVVSVKLKLNEEILYIFNIYIPPHVTSADLEIFYDEFESLEYLYESKYLMIGDFNISDYASYRLNSMTSHSRNLHSFINFQNFLGLTQFNSVVNDYDRILDLVLSNQTNCQVSEALISLVPLDRHHPALDLEIPVKTAIKKLKPACSMAYNFKKANFPNLYRELLEFDWTCLYLSSDVDEALDLFYHYLYTVIDKHVPKKRPTNRQYPVWFDLELIMNVRQKHKAWKKYKNSRNPNDYAVFSRLRNSVHLQSEYLYNQYIRNIEDNLKSNPNVFWTFLNSKRGGHDFTSDNMTLNGSLLTTPQEIVDGFAKFFADSYTPCNSNRSSNPINCSERSFRLTKVSEVEVLSALKSIKPKMTTGPDLIPAFLIKDCRFVFSNPLCFIFNLILSTQTFPSKWKLSRICPVFKKGNKNEISNFRPITILCNFAKTFEVIIHNHLAFHLKHSIIPEQHGFMTGRSTVTNLFCVTQFISETIDRRSQVDVIYTDFSKAFDKLNHSLLLLKLENFGIDSSLIATLRSYLSGRVQYVQYLGFKSQKFLQTSGVPQGSVLGPLLFILFINDMVQNIDVQYLLYADDMKLFYEVTSLDDCKKLQLNLARLNTWCSGNQLPLNANKCNVMSFCRKNSVITHNYSIDDIILERPESVKDLGVLFDAKLSFTLHTEKIVAAAYRMLGFVIRNMRQFRDELTFKLLFSAFILSRLDYASIIWSPLYNNRISLLEGVQRRFFKSATFFLDGTYPPRGIPQEQLCERFTSYSLANRRKLQYIKFLYKVVNHRIDCPAITSLLNFRVPRISSRNHHLFLPQTYRTNMYKSSPLYQMLSSYADIESEVDILHCNLRSIESSFKKFVISNLQNM